MMENGGMHRAQPAAVLLAVSMLATNALAEAPDGKQLFRGRCAACHGASGTPADAFAKKGVRDLGDPEWQKSHRDADLRKAIREGKPGTMMASFGESLSAEELDALVRYIRP